MGVYVGNLSYDVTEADLNGVFAEYGTVKRVTLPTDRETGRVRGFAFVDLDSDSEESKLQSKHSMALSGWAATCVLIKQSLVRLAAKPLLKLLPKPSLMNIGRILRSACAQQLAG